MYVRFTTLAKDEDSHALKGIFQAAFELRESGKLADYEETELNEAMNWLKQHLKSPDCLKDPKNYRALSWFHPRAVKPMQYVWRLVHILEEHGYYVQVHKITNPGIVIYEDG